LKNVGKFKGIIKVANLDEDENYKTTRKARNE
jgi:hypothetical protein